MEVYTFTSKIFADSQEEVEQFTNAFLDFVREHRSEGRAVTAAKLTEAINSWKANALVKNHIINHFK